MSQFFCDAIIFDLDGVLVDSTACVERHWRRWAIKRGIDIEEILRVSHGMRTVDTVRMFAPEIDFVSEAAELEEMESLDTQGVEAIEGAVEITKALPPGSWAVATSGTRSMATRRIAHTGLAEPLVLVTADDVARGKPDTRGLPACRKRAWRRASEMYCDRGCSCRRCGSPRGRNASHCDCDNARSRQTSRCGRSSATPQRRSNSED